MGDNRLASPKQLRENLISQTNAMLKFTPLIILRLQDWRGPRWCVKYLTNGVDLTIYSSFYIYLSAENTVRRINEEHYDR